MAVLVKFRKIKLLIQAFRPCVIFLHLFADIDCVAKVREVYSDLGLLELYKDFRISSHKSVLSKIDLLLQSDETLKNACVIFFNEAYDF